MSAAKRLRKELDEMAQNPEPFCTAGPVGDDLFVWQAVLTGPPDSPYDGGQFVLELGFPPNYPHSPPKAPCHAPSLQPAPAPTPTPYA